jgi:HSP20 family protein
MRYDMQDQEKIQSVPIKMYRTSDRLTIAAPMPGIQPKDLLITITDQNSIILQGEIRGVLKDLKGKELLQDEWSAGGYYREISLPSAVDGVRANVTYGNGVLVVSLPLVDKTTIATITVSKVGTDKGERAGHAGH